MIVLMVAFVPLIVGGFFVVREIIRQKKRELYLFLGIILSICFSYFAGIMLHINLSRVWKILTLIHLIPVSIFSILIVDVLRRETIEPWKLGFTTFLCGLLVLALLEPDSFTSFQYGNGDWYLASNSTQSFAATSLLLWSFGVFFYYSILLIRKSPPVTKKYAYIFLFSLVLISIGPIIILNLKSDNILPHFDTISNSLGFLIFAYVFSTHPEVFYILPFKVIRLTVLDMESGISLYDHTWKFNEEMVDKEVYSALFNGIRVFVKDSMKHGDIDEIMTNDAVILFQIDEETNLAFILISTKSSRLLKNVLKRFAGKFKQKFGPSLEKRSEIALFNDAKEIIDDVFKFLP